MESFDKQFSDLDTPAPAPAAPAAPAAKPADAPPAPPKPGEKPPEKPAAGVKPPEGDETFEAPQSGTLIQVRQWGRRMAEMAKNATTRAKEYEAKIQELAQRQPQLPPDVQKIQSDYQRLQRENAEFRQRQAESNYALSPDYEKEFKNPYQDAYLRGRRTVETLQVREVDPETGVAKVRPGTADDFDKLYGMTNSEADAAADAMFGPSARRVIAARDMAKEKAEAAYTALKENTAKYAQQQQQRQAQTAQQRLALRGLWTKVNTDLQTKHEQWFGEHEGDTEWNEALTKGREIARQRFSEAYARLAPEQRVILDAQIFNRAAAFTAMKLAIQRLERDRDQYKKDFEAIRGSGPGKPVPAGGAPESGPSDTWEGDFDKRV